MAFGFIIGIINPDKDNRTETEKVETTTKTKNSTKKQRSTDDAQPVKNATETDVTSGSQSDFIDIEEVDVDPVDNEKPIEGSTETMQKQEETMPATSPEQSDGID